MFNYLKIDVEKKRHYGLDLIRVMAIVSVILYHFPHNPENLVLRAISHYGYLGVDIFFVLSGFLIGGQVFSRLSKGSTISLREFFSRRFYRTLPL
jgi:peptidoglycan/LPS O-acetylase OafA/YrhL